MSYALAADAIALVHALFILFAMFGSLLVLRWPRAVWLHVPAVLWGLIVEFSGATCPLTPLESRFRGELSDSHDFLSRAADRPGSVAASAKSVFVCMGVEKEPAPLLRRLTRSIIS